jgi:membrane fusion protein (multidrug efflux system)
MKRILMAWSVAVVLSTVGCNHQPHEHGNTDKFQVTNPIQKDTMVFIEYVGQVSAVNHIELRSQEKGYLQEIFVDEGQFVRKGQLMFQIMPILYQAEKQKAEANVNFAEIEYQNAKHLADSNIVSKNELALAKAKLDKEKAELALAQAHLSFTQIRAPFDGIMDRFHERLGSLVEEGELLTTLSDNSKMWVYFNVPEAEYLDYALRNKTATQQQVLLQMANNQMFDQKGKVETIEADFNNETGNIAFRATFSNPDRVLRHGETGKVLMPVYLKNALIIPQKATFEILDKKYVYVIDEHNVVKSRLVTVGQEMPHLYVVTSGLTSNDRILIEGLRKVKNNDKIQVVSVDFEKVLEELNQLHAE